MAKDIYEESVKDVEALQRALHENAKALLAEKLSPQISKFIDEQIDEASKEKDDEDEQMDESQIVEAEDEAGEEEVDEGVELALEASDEEGGDDELELEPLDAEEDEGSKDEVVEISEADVAEAVRSILKGTLKEAQVTKSFGPVGDVNKGDTGILDKKSGESHWSDEEAPAAEDHTVKESATVRSLKRQLAEMSKERDKYARAAAYLKENLENVTLFSSKLLYSNKLLSNNNLTEAQRMQIVERLDEAKSVREAQLVFKTLGGALKMAGGVVSEGKRVVAGMKGPRASRVTTSGATLIRESLRKDESLSNDSSGSGDFARRMQELAGLVED